MATQAGRMTAIEELLAQQGQMLQTLMSVVSTPTVAKAATKAATKATKAEAKGAAARRLPAQVTIADFVAGAAECKSIVLSQAVSERGNVYLGVGRYSVPVTYQGVLCNLSISVSPVGIA